MSRRRVDKALASQARNNGGLPMTEPQMSKGPPTASLGVTGLKGSSSGFLTEEFIPELRAPFGLKQYNELAENVDLIAGILLSMTMLLRSVTWRFDPKGTTGKAKEMAEWCDTVLFKEVRRPFADVIEEIVAPMFTYGFKLMEPVYKKRDDGSVGLLDIAPRAPETTWRWWFTRDDPDEWAAWEQVTESGFRAVIPRERLLLFRTVSNNNNPEGRSLMRACYVSYQRLKLLELSEGRQAIRAAGLVVCRVPGKYMASTATVEEKAAYASYVALATDVAADKRSAVVIPSDRDDKGNLYVDIAYVPLDTQRASVSETAIERYHNRIAARFLAQWILLGAQKAGGSYALAGSQTDIFAVALGGWLKSIAAEFNRTLLPRLWKLNDFEPDIMPELAHGDLETLDLSQLASFVSALTAAGMPLFPDTKLENFLREQAGMPERDPDAEPLPAPNSPQARAMMEEADGTNASGEEDDGAVDTENPMKKPAFGGAKKPAPSGGRPGLAKPVKKYDPDQPRDDAGQWTDGDTATASHLTPLLHGTPGEGFDCFDPAKIKLGVYGHGFYFTASLDQARSYGKTILQVAVKATPDEMLWLDDSAEAQSPLVQKALRSILGDETYAAASGRSWYNPYKQVEYHVMEQHDEISSPHDPRIGQEASRLLREHGVKGSVKHSTRAEGLREGADQIVIVYDAGDLGPVTVRKALGFTLYTTESLCYGTSARLVS